MSQGALMLDLRASCLRLVGMETDIPSADLLRLLGVGILVRAADGGLDARASRSPHRACRRQGRVKCCRTQEGKGFVTLSAFSRGECSGQQASCGGGCHGPSAK